ncbi:MAG: PstA family ABC transporter permease [Alphaproteobacteria bacterium]
MTIAATGDNSSASRAGQNNALLRKRRAAEWRFKLYGKIAIGISLAFLVMLFTSMISKGYMAFVQSSIKLDVVFDPAVIDPSGTRAKKDLWNANYSKLAKQALYKQLGVDPKNRRERRKAGKLLSSNVDIQLRDMVVADPKIIGTTQTVWVLAHGNVDALLKGAISRETPEERRQLNNQQVAWVDKLVSSGALVKKFNSGLFVFGGSSQPETAGLGVAIIGSFFMMMTVVLLAVPLGVAAALYLQDFAKKNRWTDLIEVTIFINIMGLPRSASLVGGLVLSLMTLPTIIIATRAAIAAVPPSIREAALGIGASRMQTVFHHVLPLATPGILTGTIIGLAKALGETAPLLMIGMVAFVINYPTTPLDSATALPVQIFMWATEAERGFVERTAAATLVLLAFMITMNLLAVILRQRLTRKW